MIVTCPSCKRKYRLEERLVKLPYQKVRCSLCGHVFVYESSPEDKGEPGSDRTGREAGAAPKKRRGLILFLIIAALLIAAAGFAYFYWTNYLGASDRWLSINNVEGQETVITDGKIFLVKGVVINGSTKARKYVILKGRLFDEGGTVIGEHFALAGLPLSFDEVRHMSRQQIEKKVADFRLSSLSTFVLRPNGGALPFSVALPGTYSAKPKDFTVEIIEAPVL
jgi:predicted Zn finger-like uncharacterized protein